MTTLDLNGPWQVRHDPFNAGLLWGWHDKPPSDGWSGISVPSAWQSVLGMDAHGVAWYRKELPPEALDWARDARSRVRLRFESVATDCRAWVNGVEVGRHVGDYVPFDFDITRALRRASASADERAGAPLLMVRVDQIHAPRPAKGTVTENGHITKGFHDVLSAQHAGIWGGVSLRRTGLNIALPNGVSVRADARSGRLRIRVEPREPREPRRAVSIAWSVLDPSGAPVGSGNRTARVARGVVEFNAPLKGRVQAWSPDAPSLYRLNLGVRSPGAGRGARVEDHTLRFGFRTVETGGPGNRRILLNGAPLLLRAVLHWGHEPRHIAPAPPPEQVREEFSRLRALGFNSVCLCMVYMPDYFYDIADETGMLIWQEHPVWKNRTGPEFHAEYHRLFDAFLRRDARHPSVVIVSATCEHEALDRDLAAWWWERAREVLPDRLLQTQTAFTAWTDPHQTDLPDEHVYDNTGRWVRYLEDVRETLKALPAAPFVMGETIIANHWPDTSAPAGAAAANSSWWASRGSRECATFEGSIARDHGQLTLARFRAQADRWSLKFRKTQAELLRACADNAGWVMNHIRDVPACRCGFKDDAERWRFEPAQTLPWLGDAAILLRTPEQLDAHAAGSTLDLEIGLSNFGASDFTGEVTLAVASAHGGREIARVPLNARRGTVAFGAVHLEIPSAGSPRRLRLEAGAPGLIANSWDLWFLPPPPDAPAGAARLEGLDFTSAEREPEFEERAYSSGWGLKCRTWTPRLPDSRELEPTLRAIAPDAPIPSNTPVVLTHRLTRRVVEFVRAGGRALLLASRHAGSIPSRFLNLYGGVPLVIEGESSPFGAGESDWVCDLLRHDLTQRCARAIPSEGLGIAGSIAPIVRFVQTHDSGVPIPMDLVFGASAGSGMIVVSTLDHGTLAGRYVLRRLLNWTAAAPAPRAPELDLARWALK